jgi:hypothetical protein
LSRIFIERSFTYSCSSKLFCIELLEKLEEEIALGVEVYAELKQDKIIFRIFGLEPSVEEAIVKIKNFITQFTKIKALNPKQGLTAEQLSKLIHKAIPLDVLAEVLKKQGIAGVVIKGNTIYADTDLETLQVYSQLIAKALDKTKFLRLSYNIKKAITAAIALYNIDVREILEKLKNCGMLNENEELIVPWQRALDCLEEAYSM